MASNDNNRDFTNRISDGSRILYVDPNNVYGTINGIPLTPDYTDLCISFDLEVETVPRTGYVLSKKQDGTDKEATETYHFSWTSYQANTNPDDNWVSFTKGEDYLGTNYLTTYYTDINLNDFRSKDVVEGLGVESVNVTFESYYTPTIKIRFIDTRGASLFGRQEATHIDNKVTQDSIWGCFFTFPYPKFILQIKGFYGHAVTYQLTCTDFRAKFNSKTGNFDIDVTFLGYDYGILCDIPTAYLMAAPYSEYVGRKYWEDHKSTEEWRLADGNEPSKLFDIRRQIRSSMRSVPEDKNGTSVSDGDNGADYADKVAENYALNGVVNAYNGIVSAITTYQGTVPYMYNIENVYRFTYEGKLYYLITAQGSSFWNLLKEKSDVFYEKVDEFRNNYEYDGTLLTPENLVFYGDTREKTVFNSANTQTDVLNLARTMLDWRLNPTSPIKEVGTNFVEDSVEMINFYGVKNLCEFKGGECYDNKIDYSKTYQIIPLGKTEEILKNLSNQLSAYKDSENDNAQAEHDETDSYESRLSIYEAAGLTPTIENVFKTIMCHMETFMAMVYECKKNIDTQITGNLRTPEKLGVRGYQFQDLKTGDASTTLNRNLPPFVAVTVDEPKGNTGETIHDAVQTMGWVGSFEGETVWEEAKLIEGLSLAWKKKVNEEDTIKTVYNSQASLTCLPSDVFTDVFPEAATQNPYSLGEYLGIRAAAMFGIVGYDSKSADALGKADAINLYSKIGKVEIKKHFLTRQGEWKNTVKNAPLTWNDPQNPNNEREYTTNPGCETQNMIILTDTKDGKLRYSYTEAILGRGTANPQRYGMVPVVEGYASSVMGAEKSTATFVCDVPTDRNPRTRDVKAQYITGTDGRVGRIYHRMSTEAFRQKNGLAETDANGNPYQNETMFNLYPRSSGYMEAIEEQALKLNGEKLTVSEYDDTDKTWRKTISSYWKVDDTSSYLQSQSHLQQYRWTVATGSQAPEYVNIFDSKLYYAQNRRENTQDTFTIEASKCLLFLSTAGYDINAAISAFKSQQHTSVLEKVPYGVVLLMGGELWRAKLGTECLVFPENYKKFVYSDNNKSYSTISNVDYTVTYSDKNTGTTVDIFYHADSNIKQGVKLISEGAYNQIELNPNDFDENISNRLIAEFKNFVNNQWGDIKRHNEHFEGERIAYTDNTIHKFFAKKENKNWLKDNNSLKNIASDSNIQGLDESVIVSRGTLRNQATDSEGTVTFDKAAWENYADSFCTKVEEIAAYERKLDGDKPPMEEVNKEKDLKLAMYMYIKRLWDRWFMMSNPESFKVQNYMKNFVFMDSFYRNIGSMLHINCEKLLASLDNVDGKSMLFQLLADITTDHHCNFFGLPDYFGYGDDEKSQENAVNPGLQPEDKIADMFKPIPYSKKEELKTSNKFIVMLTYDQSENISDFNGYMNDDFDIFSHDDDSNNVRPATFNTPAIDWSTLTDVQSETRRIKRYGYNIPSFGIPFGRQENAIFKTVDIGMTNPIATEQSINALSIIAEKGGGNDKAICYYGQDLFPVYNGYSYECTVEMMGDAQIMPLMYFQLLNTPIFRGTYMIYSVTHTMRPGDMTTTFKGTKLSRFALPFAQGWYIASENGQGFYVNNDREIFGGNTLDEQGCECSLIENDITWDSKYFKLSQMTRSTLACQLGIDNCPPDDIKANLKNLMVNCLDKLREQYGKEIRVTSGYRSPKLNAAVQNRNNPNRKISEDSEAARKSQHTWGMAADISPKQYSVDELKVLFGAAVELWEFDQLIYEAPSNKNPWIHISYKSSGNRHNMLYTTDLKTYTTIGKDNWKNYIY